MRTIAISDIAYDKFTAIMKNRPQDKSRAETFDYILKVFDEDSKFIKVKP